MIVNIHSEKFGKFEDLLRRNKNFLVDIGVSTNSSSADYQLLDSLNIYRIEKAFSIVTIDDKQRYQRGKCNPTKVSFGLIEKRQKIMTLQMFGNSVLFVVILCKDNTVYLTQLRFPTYPIVSSHNTRVSKSINPFVSSYHARVHVKPRPYRQILAFEKFRKLGQWFSSALEQYGSSFFTHFRLNRRWQRTFFSARSSLTRVASGVP